MTAVPPEAPTRCKNVPLVLIIRDGWGENPNPEHDAFNAPKVASARGLTPIDDMLRRSWPKTLIKTSGEDVGLPAGTMGNSEVGHQNIGAGRIVPQESLVMTAACTAGLEKNDTIAAAIRHAKESGKSLHLLGIASDAGVHGQLEHLYAILHACKTLGLVERVYLHLFTDGRDTGPFSGLAFVAEVEKHCREIGVGRVASLAGRYYAMDRDHRWERVKLAYDNLTGRGEIITAASAQAAIQAYYDSPSGETLKGDEFIRPIALGNAEEVRASRIIDGDSVIFYNYRGDRPRELSAAFVFPDDKWAAVKASPDSGTRGFERSGKLDLHYVTMTAYWEELAPFVKVAFPKPPRMKNTMGEWLASMPGGGLAQLRDAETEKYPHVTFFFNDYRDEPWPKEDRQNPQSPKVATYDMKPEMAAADVCKVVLDRLYAPSCVPFIVVNFANPDMVGHTGNLEAAVKACAAVDQCVGQLINATVARGGALIITADHGNCEQMFDPATGSPHTAHTTYDVPLFVVGESFRAHKLRGDFDAAGWFKPEVRAARGRLADIAPTALALMGLPKPPEMTGKSLLA